MNKDLRERINIFKNTPRIGWERPQADFAAKIIDDLVNICNHRNKRMLAMMDEFHGTPCAQIRHRFEIEELKAHYENKITLLETLLRIAQGLIVRASFAAADKEPDKAKTKQAPDKKPVAKAKKKPVQKRRK